MGNSKHNVKFFIKVLAIISLCLLSFAIQGAEVISANVFGLPASDYTHVIIETNQVVSHSMLILKDPNRLVLDLKNTPINNQLKALSKKSFSDDLCIKQVRIGNFKAGVTRIVFDLKDEVKAVLHLDKPHDNYKHRLMLDIEPLQNANNTANQMDMGADTKMTDSKTKDSTNTNSNSTGAKIILEPPPYDEIQSDADE